MNSRSINIFTLVVATFFLSCKKQENNNPISVNRNVYVAGYEMISTVYYPVLWKNGVSTQLSNNSGEAYSVSVSGTDVYVAGTEKISTVEYPILWKNGVRTQLSNTKGFAVSVSVSGTNVYVAG